MSTKKAVNLIPIKDWIRLFLILLLGVVIVYAISFSKILLSIFAFIGVFVFIGVIITVRFIFLYLKSRSKTIREFFNNIEIIWTWESKLKEEANNYKITHIKESNEVSQVDFYRKINRYVVHNVKNSTKNLSALVTQLQDQYLGPPLLCRQQYL